MGAPFSVEQIQDNIYNNIQAGVGRTELETTSDFQICWGWREFVPGTNKDEFYDELHSAIDDNFPNTAAEFRFIFNQKLADASEALNPKGFDRPDPPPCS